MSYTDIEEVMASEPGSTYWDEYVWGQVIDRHLFGDYCILEYTCKIDNVTRYHPYFYGVEKNGKILPGVGKKARWIDFNHSYSTFDEAVLGAVAMRWQGWNSQAGTLFARALGMIKY